GGRRPKVPVIASAAPPCPALARKNCSRNTATLIPIRILIARVKGGKDSDIGALRMVNLFSAPAQGQRSGFCGPEHPQSARQKSRCPWTRQGPRWSPCCE